MAAAQVVNSGAHAHNRDFSVLRLSWRSGCRLGMQKKGDTWRNRGVEYRVIIIDLNLR